MAEKFLEEGEGNSDLQKTEIAPASPAGAGPGPDPRPLIGGLAALALAACGEKAIDQVYPTKLHTQALEAADIPTLGARELIPCTEFGDDHPNVLNLGEKQILLFANAGRLQYIYFDEDGTCHRQPIDGLPEGDYSSAIIYFNAYSGRLQMRITDQTGQILQTEVAFDFGGNLEVTRELTPTELTTDPGVGIVRNNVGYAPVGQMGFIREGVLQLQNLVNGDITDTEIFAPDDFENCGLPHTDGITVGSYLKMVGDGVHMCTLIYSEELATLYELRQEIPRSEGDEGKKDPRIDGDSIIYRDDDGDEGLYRRKKQEPEEGGDDDVAGDDDDAGDDDATPSCTPALAPLDAENPECTVADAAFEGDCTLDIDLCEGNSAHIKLTGQYTAAILQKTGQLLLGELKVNTTGTDFDTTVNHMLLDGLANSDYGAMLSSLGELLVYCTEGRVDIYHQGRKIISLSAGDYARFDADSGATLSHNNENGAPAPLKEVPREYLFDCQSGQSGEATPSFPLLGLLLILASSKLRTSKSK